MQFTQRTLFVLLVSYFSSHAIFAMDSAAVKALDVTPKSETYLLDHGSITTAVDNYSVNSVATTKRCGANSEPLFFSNIASIQVYGSAQAIEGVNNTLTMNPTTYEITGSVSAPVNVAARDNGVTINWQIWCHPTETA